MRIGIALPFVRCRRLSPLSLIYMQFSGVAASYISYNFARGGHCGSNILYSPIEEQKRACSPIFAIECPKILKNIQHAMQKNLLFSQLCAYMVTSEQYLAEILGSLYLLVGFSMILLSNIHFLYVGAQYAFKILLQFLTLSL